MKGQDIMAIRQMHLDKSGSGMAAKTACGRNILRTPMSTNWEEFKNEAPEHQCAKCAASKQAAVNARSDAKKEAEALAKWETEDQDDWKRADDALTAKRRNA